MPWAPDRVSPRILPSAQGPRITAALSSEHGRTLVWFSDDLLTVSREDDGTLWFEDHRYGMYTDPSWTLFRAVLPVGGSEESLILRQPGSDTALDPAEEIRAGWRLMTGS